jgi:rod shape-determining protein MreD
VYTLLFVYTSFLGLLLSNILPNIQLLYFAPFLTLCLYRLPFSNCLWWALICGFVVDLFSSQLQIGTFALIYCLTVAYLHHFKKHFFEDHKTTLPLMTFAFAICSTLLQFGIFYVMGKPFALSWIWMKNDLFWMPLQDALYGVLFFSFLQKRLLTRKWASPSYLMKKTVEKT